LVWSQEGKEGQRKDTGRIMKDFENIQFKIRGGGISWYSDTNKGAKISG